MDNVRKHTPKEGAENAGSFLQIDTSIFGNVSNGINCLLWSFRLTDCIQSPAAANPLPKKTAKRRRELTEEDEEEKSRQLRIALRADNHYAMHISINMVEACYDIDDCLTPAEVEVVKHLTELLAWGVRTYATAFLLKGRENDSVVCGPYGVCPKQGFRHL